MEITTPEITTKEVASLTYTCNLANAAMKYDCQRLNLVNIPTDCPVGVQQFWMQNNLITSISSNVFSNAAASLLDIDIRSNAITFISEGAFTGLHLLTSLTLLDNQITSITNGTFSELISLKELSLSMNSISSLPSQLFCGLQSLEQLWLGGNQFSSVPVGALQGLPNLRSLRLDSMQLKTITNGTFANFPNLEDL